MDFGVLDNLGFLCPLHPFPDRAFFRFHREGNGDPDDCNVNRGVALSISGKSIFDELHGSAELVKPFLQDLPCCRVGVSDRLCIQETDHHPAAALHVNRFEQVLVPVGKGRIHQDQLIPLVGAVGQKIIVDDVKIRISDHIRFVLDLAQAHPLL